MDLKAQFLQARSWEQCYRLIIQASKNLPPPKPELLETMTPIQDCETGVWFKISPQTDRTFHFTAYSESRIINGLLWILLLEIQHKNTDQLQYFSVTDYFTRLGVIGYLSSTRLKGFRQIEQMLKNLSHHNFYDEKS